MSTWGNADLLIEMLERHAGYLLAQQRDRRVLLLPRWLAFVGREPQLAGLVKELVQETKSALEALALEDYAVREQLQALWKEHEGLVRERLAEVFGDDQVHAYGHMDEFANEIAERPPAKLPLKQLFDEDQTKTEKLVLALTHWASWATSLSERNGVSVEPLVRLNDWTKSIALSLQFLKRRLRVMTTSSPGAALHRLTRIARAATPKPPARPDEADEEGKEVYGWDLAFFERTNDFAISVHSRVRNDTRALDTDEVDTAAANIGVDVELVTHELQLRILAGRSRIALVQRYAAQCEGFDAAMLRQLALNSPGRVERQLTLDFAKYLFQQGLTPLLDATIGGLRPDVVDTAAGGLLYVEAKQYGAENPRGAIVAAYRQVWSTWERLAKLHSVAEAFLLIFRVAGPRIELPTMLRSSGRSLYAVVVDISEAGGSQDKGQPVTIEPAELLPLKADQSGNRP